MKMRLFVALGAVSVMALGLLGATGCSDGTTTGSGGAGGTASVGNGGAGGGTAGGGGGTAGGGGTGGMMCSATCAEAATPGNPAELCAGATQAAMDAFGAVKVCSCDPDPTKGKCTAKCADNLCMGMAPSTECQACVPDAANGCGTEFATCANN